MAPPIHLDKLECSILSPTQTGLAEFKCSNPDFEAYLCVEAHNDAIEQVGKTWVFTLGKTIVGFVTIAMDHVEQEMHKDLDLGTYGDVPALLIGHLATHRDYERNGIGSHMVAWAINKALELSGIIGCRVVILNAEKNAIGFYKKLNFTHVPHDGGDTMFIDIKKIAGGFGA